ncbi:MAG: nuclear transport factor 2 family protein [Desulfobacterales bacterium]|nr:nuclear transport factor 2 family protein [Deltaproteobacteria bacterium]MBT8361141.1 nuclear transport factor 2 family protein [Deltaproteobacteria bacterium]NNK93526.1 nuclear transport factor 2 family protein [Desulfobacterales bacterium]
MKPLDSFLEVYEKLDAENLHLLDHLYSDDISFIDPAHKIEGLAALKKYFFELYQNVSSINFSFYHHQQQDNNAYIQWQMNLRHPRLNRNQEIIVPGISYLHYNQLGKVSLHRDYFDLGAMLYEQLPLLGSIIKAVKRRLGQ